MDFRHKHRVGFKHHAPPPIQSPIKMKLLTSLLMLLLIQGCASVQAPQGGPKDSEAPRLIRSNPKDGETNFGGKFILLEFSENVTENELKQPFLSPISPVTVVPAGKKIKITADSGWKPNQTYELRLQKKIKDEKEGNLLADTSLVFSTGSQISTLKLEIAARDLSDRPLSGKTTVLLSGGNNSIHYSNGESSIPLGGLEKGKYLLQVFQDKNENLKYEEEDGKLFLDSIRIDSSIQLNVRRLPQMSKPIKFFHLRKSDSLILESSRLIRPDSSLLKKCVGRNEEGTLFCLYPFRGNAIFQHSDSLGTLFYDTIDIGKTDSNRSLPSIALKRKVKIAGSQKEIRVGLSWSWKIRHYPKLIEFNTDSVWKTASWEKEENGIRLTLPAIKPGKIRIRYDSLLFYNQKSQKLDSILLQHADLEQTGKISGTIESEELNLRIDLINATKEIAGSTTKGNFSWQAAPGQYRIQVYKDVNADGKYTGGNRILGRKAEPLYEFPDKIELKAGWDLENIKVKPVF